VRPLAGAEFAEIANAIIAQARAEVSSSRADLSPRELEDETHALLRIRIQILGCRCVREHGGRP
jgi:hypothetical protein